MTTAKEPWVNRAARLPAAIIDEFHEAAHAVAAARLGVPFTRILADERGYALDRPQWGRQPTAAELIGVAMVAAAGGAGVWLIAAPPGVPDAIQLASESDLENVTKCAGWYRELYPEVRWPEDVWAEAAALFIDYPMQLATDRVARMLQAAGHVPADVVCSVLAELGIGITPVQVQTRTIVAEVPDDNPDDDVIPLAIAPQDAQDSECRAFALSRR